MTATFDLADSNIDTKSGYDIDSIEPGDTCKILNLPPLTSRTFGTNMTIKRVHYTLDKAKIELGISGVSVGEEITDITDKEKDLSKVEIPDRFTSL